MMALLIYNRPFLLRMRSPQQKHHAFAMLVNQADHFIGEGFPAEAGVGMRLTCAYRQHSIE